VNGTYRIAGGHPLTGTVTPIPNKNSLMGALPLALLTDEVVRYKDLPKTTDVECFLEIFEQWGAKVNVAPPLTSIATAGACCHEVPVDIGRRFRGAFSLAGPLLARFGKAAVPIPGGCKLGARSVATHINSFREMGIEIDIREDCVYFNRPTSWGGSHSVWLPEASVTATLNVAMFAAASNCEVEIIDAACEPHVVDVLDALVAMGATIEGIGTNKLLVKGSDRLSTVEFAATPDFVDIAGYCVAAAVTRGTITIESANRPALVNGIVKWFRLFGLEIEQNDTDLVVHGDRDLVINMNEFPLASRDLPKLVVRPWPGFPVDVMPVMVTLATKATGRILFQNWMYESGFDFVRELTYLGADIYMSDPQRIIVMEPKIVYNGGVVGSPGVIQGTKAIFLAALADDATTVLHGTDILRRRYPDILNTYRSLGARIEETQ
jgi:UDP-N-acetylglucosamine 1-carboxyvinyltransferase